MVDRHLTRPRIPRYHNSTWSRSCEKPSSVRSRAERHREGVKRRAEPPSSSPSCCTALATHHHHGTTHTTRHGEGWTDKPIFHGPSRDTLETRPCYVTLSANHLRWRATRRVRPIIRMVCVPVFPKQPAGGRQTPSLCIELGVRMAFPCTVAPPTHTHTHAHHQSGSARGSLTAQNRGQH